MAILKIKDSSGQWVNLNALKGDPGPEGPKGDSGVHVGTSTPTSTDSIWIDTNQNASSVITTINNQAPDNNGNIAAVTSVNGKLPDSNGNVVTVSTVNGAAPDSNGNVNVNVISSILPDLTAGVSLAANTAAPSDGWIYVEVRVDETYWTLNIDGVKVGWNGGSKLQGNSEFLLIAKGSSVNYAGTFYPLKGA